MQKFDFLSTDFEANGSYRALFPTLIDPVFVETENNCRERIRGRRVYNGDKTESNKAICVTFDTHREQELFDDNTGEVTGTIGVLETSKVIVGVERGDVFDGYLMII